jgi:alkanesulfonate monooxygenase SsuD/methylene tetrahydromethanopterin reductase-like flavin-dependent oxidoreductase (luciferase family)
MPAAAGYAGTGADHSDEHDLEPMLESWTALAALAVAVPRVRLGILVSPTTHRHPAILAKMAATVDRISGGRVVLGIGAGWQVNEHRAYGLPLPSIRQRLDRLEESCRVVRRLLNADRSDYAGEHFTLDNAPLAPKPIGPLPLVVGGAGERRTLRIVARYADEWNVWGTPTVVAHKSEILAQYCQEEGRDPHAIRRSANVLIHTPDSGSRHLPGPPRERPTLEGSVDEVIEQAQLYRHAGVDELVVADFNLTDQERALELIEELGTAVDAKGTR